ncbi:MAG: zf-HC2 domain-containing protein [Actinomycetota bacterium]|nr:zf-HC2 domain-containing protein [Actinomycetota bacterium]
MSEHRSEAPRARRNAEGARSSRPAPDGHLGDLLSALLDRELSMDREIAARQHLEGCATCAGELENVRLARSWVRALPAVEPPFGFLERIVYGPEPRRYVARPSVRRRIGVAALTASAAAAVALVGVTPPRDTPVSPSVARLVEAHATGASLENDPLSRLAPLAVPVSFGR